MRAAGSGAAPPAALRRRAEVAGYRDLWRAAPAGLARRWGLAGQDLGEGVCLGCAGLPRSPIFNHAIGVGVDSPAGEAQLEAMGRFYGTLGSGYTVTVAARAGDLDARLRERGFADDRPWMTLRRPIGDIPETSTELRVAEASPRDRAAFGEIVAGAFGMPDELAGWVAAIVGRPGWTCLLALDGDAPVGAAALFVHGHWAWLALGAARAEHRGRGSQGALFAARMRRAAALGARHLVTETGAPVAGEDPGPSYRNMLRMGIAEAELRPNLRSPG